MNKKKFEYNFVFHTTDENKSFIFDYVKDKNLKNIDVISDENIKREILSNSVFAVCKSGTVSLQVCNSNVPSIIIYKLKFYKFYDFQIISKCKIC